MTQKDIKEHFKRIQSGFNGTGKAGEVGKAQLAAMKKCRLDLKKVKQI